LISDSQDRSMCGVIQVRLSILYCLIHESLLALYVRHSGARALSNAVKLVSPNPEIYILNE
jgi:hypothetical protein